MGMRPKPDDPHGWPAHLERRVDNVLDEERRAFASSAVWRASAARIERDRKDALRTFRTVVLCAFLAGMLLMACVIGAGAVLLYH